MRLFLSAFIVIAAGCGRFLSEAESSVEHIAGSDTRLTYQCESGNALEVSYHSGNTAIVEYEGNTLRMRQMISASGVRYVGGELEWWTKGGGPGSTGTLFHHESDGTTGEVIEQCEQASSER